MPPLAAPPPRAARSAGKCSRGRSARRRLAPVVSPSGSAPGPAALTAATAAAATATAATTVAATPAHGTEPLAILPAPTARLAGGPEALELAARAALREAVVSLAEAFRHDLALVDPDLHADPAEGGLGLGEAVVDVRAQRVERDPSFRVGLPARHVPAPEPPGAGDLDALGA